MPPDKKSENKARAFLQDPDFFGKVRDAVRRGGLVGEERNALTIYVIAMSSLLERPLNAIVKGPSSTGKNHLVSRVLQLFPEDAIREITSSSETALNYAKDTYRNKIVYLNERNKAAAGAVFPMRTLISERRIVRTVSVREGGQWIQKEFVAEGPIAALSTSTRDRIEIDDETRHLSLWMDDSREQTRRIIISQLSPPKPLPKEEVEVWHQVYRLIAERASSARIEFRNWTNIIAEKVYSDTLRVRRYFPAFLEAVRTVALIRSFRRKPDDYDPKVPIYVMFGDYAFTTYIFEDVFVKSLQLSDDESDETRNVVEQIASTQEGKAVNKEQFARYLKISADQAYSKLRSAWEAGAIVRANKPEKNNNKFYLPAPRPSRFVPDPEEVLQVMGQKKPISFVHPLTGKKTTLLPRPTGKKEKR